MAKELKYINLIGLEIEGGWDTRRDDLTEDGSVKSGDFSNSVCVGELVSPPIDFESAVKYISDNWPTETQVKCGFHVHVSFKSINSYCLLMCQEFYDKFLSDMKKFGDNYPITNECFWDRLENRNKFCRKVFIPEKQISLKAKGTDTRYSHLNFCYGMHKTLECRLFPTFMCYQAAQAAFVAFIECVENYLASCPPISESHEEELYIEEFGEKTKEVETSQFKLKPFSLFSGFDGDKLNKSNSRKNTKKDASFYYKDSKVRSIFSDGNSPVYTGGVVYSAELNDAVLQAARDPEVF